MSLEKYHKKRKFQKTPEPKGSVKKNNGPLTFVVQKHEASRLHYDFRLELNGVLKSWAIPKGPSLNSEDRHMAIMVEDHPMDYASFEGIIPKGNYGAGTVMVWDYGVYSPIDSVERKDAEKILNEQLEKGHLTFIMLGKKLKGEFALIRAPKMGDDAWLIIKKGDEYASKKDILTEDKSATTGRSMEQIEKQAEKKDEIWIGKPKNVDLGNAPKGDIPHVVKPMLATAIEEPFDKADWLFEMKWDGYRAVAEIQAGNVRLYSRNNQPYNEKFDPIAQSLKKFPGTTVLDGEVVVVDKNGKPNFGWLQDYPKSKNGELIYYVFDILHFDGHNLEKLPLLKRKEILKKLLPPLPHIAYSQHIEESGIEFFKQAFHLQVEGIMAKNAQSTYREGVRSQEWLKIKTHMRQEAVIAGFTEPKGGRNYFGALILGIYKKGKLVYIGHTGGGFDDQDLKSIYGLLKPLEQKECPFETQPITNAPATWVHPKLLCEVTFSEWTKDNIMRHPIFLGMRRDKNAEEVEKEPVISSKTKQTEQIQISNPLKVFWPEEGYTKGDLVEYYKTISTILLPYLKDRPESLKRYPDGIKGKVFFQKNISNLKADWLETVKVHSESEDKTIEFMLCQDESSLLYMINLGCIDINPWNSRIKHLDHPDYLIIDLDPEEVPFATVVKTALEVRKFLEKVEIESYPKTSGAKGMHIYIPLNAQYNYEQTRRFAELLCLQIQSKIPDITSMVRSPQKRQKKVYLDYLQNRKGQTLASVYSVRPEPGATVSTPLQWKEVNSKLHPSQFTLKTVLKRIDRYGDLFEPVLKKGVNMERVLKNLDKLLTTEQKKIEKKLLS